MKNVKTEKCPFITKVALLSIIVELEDNRQCYGEKQSK